jgi:hypothetical protein
MWRVWPYSEGRGITPIEEHTMNAYIAADLANERHARMIADAASYRRAYAARPVRAARRNRRPRSAWRIASLPLAAFTAWVAAGEL